MKNVETAKKCGKKAIEVGVKRFIEVSTAQVYEPSKAPATEDATIGPWTTQAAKRLEAENELIALKKYVKRRGILYASFVFYLLCGSIHVWFCRFWGVGY